MTECEYLHALCSQGCTKMVCRSHFPERQPLVMEDAIPFCKSPEHAVDCEQYKDGKRYQEERRASKKGCPYLENKICGNPNVWFCAGGDVKWLLKGTYMDKTADNDITGCMGPGYPECPNYLRGLEVRLEWAKRGGVNNLPAPPLGE